MAKPNRAGALLSSFEIPEQTVIINESGVDLGPLGAVAIDPFSLPPSIYRQIVPSILRRIDVSNDDLRMLLADSDVDISGMSAPLAVTISFPRLALDQTEASVLVNEMAAGSAFIFELAARTAEVFLALGIDLELSPPTVEAKVGSISFSLGGSSMIAAGLAFVVASHSDLLSTSIAAAQIAYYGGALTSVLGVVELAVNWYKTIKDAQKADSEIVLNKLKADEIRGTFPPASSLLDQRTIVARSLAFNQNPIVGTHLLNKVLPSCVTLGKAYSPQGASRKDSEPKGMTLGAGK